VWETVIRMGPKPRLTANEMQEIRLAYAEKKSTQEELAQQYGVSSTTVRRIIKKASSAA
jgi:DNA-binding transcriptional regulator LsrR (DeoR family)